jgi:hypothetical protein
MRSSSGLKALLFPLLLVQATVPRSSSNLDTTPLQPQANATGAAQAQHPSSAGETLLQKVLEGVLVTLTGGGLVWFIGRGYARSRRRAANRQQWKGAVAAYPPLRASQYDIFSQNAGRVTPSEIAKTKYGQTPPYVSRVVDDELRHGVKDKDFVILKGPTKSGKSRTAWEALRSMDCNVVVPLSHAGLSDLLTNGFFELRAHRNVVLFLDDLDRFLALDHPALNVKHLHTWERNTAEGLPSVKVVATIRNQAYTEIEAAGATSEKLSHREAGEVLKLAKIINLDTRFEGEELRVAEQLYGSVLPAFRGRLAEDLVAGPELLNQLKTDRDRNPGAYALVWAACAWRRLGTQQPVSEALLRNLLPAYLAEVSPSTQPTDEMFAAALTRATTPPIALSSVGYLIPHWERKPAIFDAFDYIYEKFSFPPSVPNITIRYALEHSTPQGLLALGTLAWGQYSDVYVARTALMRARSAGDSEVAEAATLYLGILLMDAEPSTAEDLLREARSSKNADHSARAAYWLGIHLSSTRPGEATESFITALRGESVEIAVRATTALKPILSLPDQQKLLSELLNAMNSPSPALSARASLCLGILLQDQDRDAARAVFHKAVNAPDLETVSRSAFALATLMEPADLDVAITALEQTPTDLEKEYKKAVTRVSAMSRAYAAEMLGPEVERVSVAAYLRGRSLRSLRQYQDSAAALRIAAASASKSLSESATHELWLSLLAMNSPEALEVIPKVDESLDEEINVTLAEAEGFLHAETALRRAVALSTRKPKSALKVLTTFIEADLELPELQPLASALAPFRPNIRRWGKHKRRESGAEQRRSIAIRAALEERAPAALVLIARLIQKDSPAGAAAAVRRMLAVAQPTIGSFMLAREAAELMEETDQDLSLQAYQFVSRHSASSDADPLTAFRVRVRAAAQKAEADMADRARAAEGGTSQP